MAKKHSVKIIWGSEGETRTTYNFASEKELIAFMQGVDEGVGWMEYDIANGEEKDESTSPLARTNVRLSRVAESMGVTRRK